MAEEKNDQSIISNPQRHKDFDGSGMLRESVVDRPISKVGDTFTVKLNRLGDDYLMLNSGWRSGSIPPLR